MGPRPNPNPENPLLNWNAQLIRMYIHAVLQKTDVSSTDVYLRMQAYLQGSLMQIHPKVVSIGTNPDRGMLFPWGSGRWVGHIVCMIPEYLVRTLINCIQELPRKTPVNIHPINNQSGPVCQKQPSTISLQAVKS